MSESLSEDVPAAIQAFIDTTNAGDSAAFVAAFTEDAFLSDGPTPAGSNASRSAVTAERVGRGREFRGHEGVADWDRTDNIGKRARFELLGVKPGTGDQQFVATVMVTGDGYTGTSDLEFTVRGDKVSRLVIVP